MRIKPPPRNGQIAQIWGKKKKDKSWGKQSRDGVRESSTELNSEGKESIREQSLWRIVKEKS